MCFVYFHFYKTGIVLIQIVDKVLASWSGL